MKNIKWVNKSRTIGIIVTAIYLIALTNSTVHGLIKKAVDNIVEGSTVYCYQSEINDAWWQNR
jgi:hypothetical protein